MKYYIQIKKNSQYYPVIDAKGELKIFKTLIEARKYLIMVMRERTSRVGCVYRQMGGGTVGTVKREDIWSNTFFWLDHEKGRTYPIYKNGKIKPGLSWEGLTSRV